MSADADEITLTMPADRDFYRVAHLVLGGLAVRLNLTFEHLEDLQLALDGLLGARPASPDEITLSVRVADDAIETAVGPFADDRLRRELEGNAGDELSLRRVLEAVVDTIEVDERDGVWVRLTKQVGSTRGAG